MAGRIRIEDVEIQNRKHPTTFQIPPLADRLQLRVGDHAKLIFRYGKVSERMWVRITTARDGQYVGLLDNEPTGIPLARGHRIPFRSEHVADIIRGKSN